MSDNIACPKYLRNVCNMCIGNAGLPEQDSVVHWLLIQKHLFCTAKMSFQQL